MSRLKIPMRCSMCNKELDVGERVAVLKFARTSEGVEGQVGKHPIEGEYYANFDGSHESMVMCMVCSADALECLEMRRNHDD